MTHFEDVREAALAYLDEMDALHPAITAATCKHCAQVIVFKPYFVDGLEPNPPVWFHPPGSKTCSTKPKGWREDWPVAEPADGAS